MVLVFGVAGCERSGPCVAGRGCVCRMGAGGAPSAIIVATPAMPGAVTAGAGSGNVAGPSATPTRVRPCDAAYCIIVLPSTGAVPGASERVGAIGGDVPR